ncbi:MAG: hypothetical protein HYY20_10760 [Candidatus Tectomicrobia bacterium]|uniref:Uncharacterized protein n=1 Tax=Tectimicrobiota bacterium TaxID=2528274 RepID=A0A932CQE6_UNCTE|nr:hypothetical protein [Candidatus Tectomicrobia bacterium]
MLNRFDWLRRSRTGAELLATLHYLESHPGLPPDGEGLGPPPSALNSPCLRCWIYPRATTKPNARYCPTCRAILDEAWQVGELSRHAVVVWGSVNQLPRQLRTGSGPRDSQVLGTYVHDENHFLLMLYHLGIKSWLQELAIYHGADLKGLIQFFPTTGSREIGMGDLLCWMIHQEARFPKDRLRVRFFSASHQIFSARFYEREGVLTFEVTEFLNMLEMASVFRSVLGPEEQEILRKLLHMGDTNEAQFYWGRFLGSLGQEGRDMLNAWKVRQWSKPRINLFYELIEYVEFYQLR